MDNLFASVPMKHVEKMYYLNVDFYRYYIGRKDQSVNENMMISRIDQQLKVNCLMLKQLQLEQIEEKKLKKYLYHYLEIVTVISSVMLLRSGTSDNLQKKAKLWQYIEKEDCCIYKRMRWGLFGVFLNLHGIWGRKIPVIIYQMARRIIGFN